MEKAGLLNICVDKCDYLFINYLMNRMFKRNIILFLMEILCNTVKVLTATFNQFNASSANKNKFFILTTNF